MNPDDPSQAQQIVVAYARLLERDLSENRHPARIDSLPFAKPVIKSAIRTSLNSVRAAGQLTDDLKDFLETAYTSLAEYVDRELAQLMADYRDSAEQIADDGRTAREKTTSAAWRTLAESSSLAGEVARAITEEEEVLRAEFRRLID